MPIVFRTFFAFMVASSLVACGGGGGDGGSPSPVSSTGTFQLKSAYISYVTDTRSLPFTIGGTVSGSSVSGSGTLTQGSIASGTFEGATALQKLSTVTGTVTGPGGTFPLNATATSYLDTNYNLLGVSANEYTVVTGMTAIPQTAMVNDTGNLYIENRYSSSSKSTLLGTQVTTFVIQPDTASSVFLKLIVTQKDTFNTTTATSTLNFRLTATGTLTRLSESDVTSTSNLTLTYQ